MFKEKLEKKMIYAFIIPAAIFVFIFNYLPMVGILMAFEDYNIFAGGGPIQALFVSEWVGFANFVEIFSDPQFLQVLRNTIQISVTNMVFTFPLPIIAAILLNEVYTLKLKKSIQTIIYMPHFLSWVIVGGIWVTMLGGEGVVNNVLISLGIIDNPVSFMTSNFWFRIVLVLSSAWKEVGWGTIIYLAAITSIDYQLYEAIRIDGGNKFSEIKNITLPGISNTIVMLLILRMASIMDAGFDQIFNMYSPFVYEYNDVISTYVYRIGIGGGEYSISTAVGLFNSVIGFTLLMISNRLARKVSGRSIW